MPASDTGLPPLEELTDYAEDGVDLTLIRWMLSLTPEERLQVLEDFVNFVLEVRALNQLPANTD